MKRQASHWVKLVGTQRGMSLIGVMVSVGILGIISLAFTTMFTHMINSQNTTKFLSNLTNFNEEVRAHLSSKTACYESFKHLAMTSNSIHSIASLKNIDGSIKYALATPYGDRAFQIESMTLSLPAFAPGAYSGDAALRINYTAKSKVFGPAGRGREILIRVQKNSAHQLTECIALAKMTDGIWRRSPVDINRIFFIGGLTGIGTSMPIDMFHLHQGNFRHTKNDSWALQSTIAYSSIYHRHSAAIVGMRARGSMDSPLYPQAGDTLATFTGRDAIDGLTDTAFGGAAMTMLAAEDFSSTSKATSLNFATTPSNGVIQIDRMIITPSGDVGIGTASPSDKLHVMGDIRIGRGGTSGCLRSFSGGTIAGTCSSDARLKRNFRPLGSVSDKLLQISPKFYQWRSDEFPEKNFGDQEELGLVAQDLINVIPELVQRDEDGLYRVRYQRIPFYLIKGFKEQHEAMGSIDEKYAREIAALKSENRRLRDRLEAIESRLGLK